jgi:hypothetical protein
VICGASFGALLHRVCWPGHRSVVGFKLSAVWEEKAYVLAILNWWSWWSASGHSAKARALLVFMAVRQLFSFSSPVSTALQATLQLVDSRHIVSLYSITFRVLSFAIRPQSARCSSTTVTLPSSGLTVSAVQETKFPPHLLYSSPEGAVGEGQWQLFVIPPCKSLCVSMYWDLRILNSLCL